MPGFQGALGCRLGAQALGPLGFGLKGLGFLKSLWVQGLGSGFRVTGFRVEGLGLEGLLMCTRPP